MCRPTNTSPRPAPEDLAAALGIALPGRGARQKTTTGKPARSTYVEPEGAMALRNKLLPMRAQLIRKLTVALDGEKLALLAAIGGAIAALDAMLAEQRWRGSANSWSPALGRHL